MTEISNKDAQRMSAKVFKKKAPEIFNKAKLALEKFDPKDKLPEDGETVLVCEEEEVKLPSKTIFRDYWFIGKFEKECYNPLDDTTGPMFQDTFEYSQVGEIKFWCRLPLNQEKQ